MAKEISIFNLEEKIRILTEQDSSLTVELSNISKEAYDHLKEVFGGDYEVRGVTNILRIEEVSEKGYTVHIRKK